MSNRNLVWIGVVWLIVLSGFISAVLTRTIVGAPGWSGLAQSGGVYVSDEEYALIERYSRLEEVRSVVEEEYYVDVDESEMILGAMRGMLESLGDKYTFYYTAEEMASNVRHNSGVYEGIGVTLAADQKGALTILRVYRDTPAERTGILAGDVLTHVNGEPVSGADAKEVDNAVARIQDSGSLDIELTVTRGDDVLRFTLRREQIQMNRVDSRLLEGDIGYIQITEFLGDDVEGFRDALDGFGDVALRGLIIDLRSNTGGYLDDVVAIADILLPEGLIVYTEDRAGNRREEMSDAAHVDYPVVCLVNDMSASASEVLAGAVQDYGSGVIIGETTYGKGIVQTVLTFADGTGMQLTTATYYTPLGRCIHGVGIAPDIVAPDDPATASDETLDIAVDWLTGNDAG